MSQSDCISNHLHYQWMTNVMSNKFADIMISRGSTIHFVNDFKDLATQAPFDIYVTLNGYFKVKDCKDPEMNLCNYLKSSEFAMEFYAVTCLRTAVTHH